MSPDPRARDSNAGPFSEFHRTLDELTQQVIAARRLGRNANDAALDLLQVLHREDGNWAVVHLAFAITALAHLRTVTEAATTASE
ncbi:hypothetical protein ACIRSS_48055 [Amycolatopsis sp. NPDC101161]|uniref:hypothetical protein n=1 Tax=Amycolatopsis sp. NPDC101161 TaxID=3363940 RepID=UPI003826E92A